MKPLLRGFVLNFIVKEPLKHNHFLSLSVKGVVILLIEN